MKNVNNIGKRILEVRLKKGYTQEELAEKIGSVASYVSNIERKNKTPSLNLLRKIVKTLDTSYDYLLQDDFDITKQEQIKNNILIKEIESLDEDLQHEFLNVANVLIKSLKNIQEGRELKKEKDKR